MCNYTIGIDIGSSSSKAVLLKDGREITKTLVVQTGIGSNASRTILNEILELANLALEDIKRIVVTGYGRFTFVGANKQISEISCHAKGIHFLLEDARTIIDIGGQDAKAISLNDKGNVQQFFMNDKCAAGTGRFITVMAKLLEVPLDKMGYYDSLSKNGVSVSSTCTVFAETEVISQLSNNIPVEDIVAGIHDSVAQKVCGLVRKTPLLDKIVLCGGGAKNTGILRALKENLKRDVIVAPNPQTTGALGAAIYAYEGFIKGED